MTGPLIAVMARIIVISNDPPDTFRLQPPLLAKGKPQSKQMILENFNVYQISAIILAHNTTQHSKGVSKGGLGALS